MDYCSISGFNYLQLIFVNVYAVHKDGILAGNSKIGKALDDVFTVFCLRVFFVSGTFCDMDMLSCNLSSHCLTAFFQGFV